MKRTTAFLFFLVVAIVGHARAEENPYGLPDGLYTEITTPRGVVVCELFYRKTPMTVANYVGLAEGTLGPEPRKPYYEGLKWHRVVADFVVQGGQGGRIGYQFPDEIVPGLRHDSPGVLQMANSGPDSNGSQYCLMLSPQQRLNYNHTIFGHVVRGLDVLPQIQQGDTMSVKILRLGDAAKAFKADEETFKELIAKAKRYTGARQPGPDTPFDDPDKVLPTEYNRAQYFNYKLSNYERFTGRKIVSRLFAKTAEGANGGGANAYLRGLAEKLGVAQAGGLAVYFADRDEWQVWIGNESLAEFIKGPLWEGSPKADETIQQAKDEFLASAKKKADEFIAAAQKTAGPDKPLSQGQKVKLETDAVLDGLIFKLEPKS